MKEEEEEEEEEWKQRGRETRWQDSVVEKSKELLLSQESVHKNPAAFRYFSTSFGCFQRYLS